MDYREKAVRCVRETVLPVQAAQFRACGCDLDAQYRKYGDTESFFAKVLQPGRLYEVGYPKCVCPEVLGYPDDGDCFFSEVYGDKCFCASSDPAHYRVLFIFQHTAVVAKGSCMYPADCYVYYGC